MEKITISPSILVLFKAVGARLKTADQGDLTWEEVQTVYAWGNGGGGHYSHLGDYIFITGNESPGSDPNMACLHELIHWSGNWRRLARPQAVIIRKVHVEKVPEKQLGITGREWEVMIHTEEAIAQMGAFKLTKALGGDVAKAKSQLNHYLTNYPLANLEEANRESDLAVRWLLAEAQATLEQLVA